MPTPAFTHVENHQLVIKPKLQPKTAQAVHLPQTTAELVNRMLAARCGLNRP